MALELLVDSGPPPHDLPFDAIAILVWRDDLHPKRYEFVAIVTGASTLAEVAQAVGTELPQVAGRAVLATKIGGNSARVKRLIRSESTTVAVEEVDVEAPEPVVEEPAGG